ncbi:MAG TPA: SpoIIE family protein phosphatase [Polyangiaceae bacterium]|jgi:serine phosphatase RsbU (regulator of sigma subunit)|nr:SpoIIE family protein phosphatase [Polyangiaceae bacterium]
MFNLSIAKKLLLLTGIPVLGAFVLSGLVAVNARHELARSEALGSIESLAELSEDVSSLLYRLEVERSKTLLALGERKPHVDEDSDEALEAPSAAPAPELAALDRELDEASRSTDQALHTLREFLARRDLSRLPKRLTSELNAALTQLAALPNLRASAAVLNADPRAQLETYGAAARGLLRAISALSELTDDGELLRSIASLVAVLELQERASIEHALLSYVFAVGDFPPGTYRDLLTLLTEEHSFIEGLRTNGTAQHFDEYVTRMRDPNLAATERFRKVAIEAAEGAPAANANAWFAAQNLKVDALHGLEVSLNREVHARALGKLHATRAALWTGSVLAGTALFLSVTLALFIGQGITGSIHTLKDAAFSVARGRTNVRVQLKTRDELETLGNAFNDMTEELSRARRATQEQARMARDLEIAAGIQKALLPPSLRHPDFEFAGRMRPADEVGGDFYDVLSDPRSGSLWLTIGDVSGHGVPAGLVMLITQSAFAAYFRANPLARPDEVIRGVNGLLNEQIGVRLRDDKYVTGLLLAHAGGGSFVFAGAHEWPIIWRQAKQRCEVIEAPGPWLGITAELEHIPVSSLHLEPGDILCLYSDGIIEAKDDLGQMFDVSGLERAFSGAASTSRELSDIADRLFATAGEHAPRRDDDWTLLLVRRAA